MKFLRQVFEITTMNLKTILERFGSSVVIIVGIAGSVAVMVSLLSMAEGLNSTIEGRGSLSWPKEKPSSIIEDFLKIAGSKNLGDERFFDGIVLI